MAKTLINAQNLDRYVDAGQTLFALGPDMILAPGAKDILCRRGIKIEYQRAAKEQGGACTPKEAKNSAQPGQKEQSSAALVQVIVRLLRKQYGIDDPQVIQKITLEVLARLDVQAQ